MKPVTALRNISLLEKFEAKLVTSTPKFVYLFFFRWFYLNLGSLVPVYFFFLIPFVLPNQVISSFSLLHFMFPIWYFKCFLSSSCCSHGHIPVVFFCVMSSKPYPGGFFCVMSSKYYRQIQYSFPFFFVFLEGPHTVCFLCFFFRHFNSVPFFFSDWVGVYFALFYFFKGFWVCSR